MKQRAFVLALCTIGSAAAAALGAACSSQPAPFVDAHDASLHETGTDETRTDAGDAAVLRDSAAPVADGSKPESGREPAGHCGPVEGPACDLVLQNCPPAQAGGAQECVLTQLTDGGFTTACAAVAGARSIQKGYPCCAGAGGADPCLPGLSCIGGEACPDGGAPTGKCSPYCCPGDDSVCGNDNQGGVGKCRLTIVGGTPQRSLYQVCAYTEICRPLGVKPCPPGSTCHVTDTSGSASCSKIFAPDGGNGLGHHQPCAAANACADGMECLGTADGGSFCEYLCHVEGTTTPFDAGALSSAPGKGGCPTSTPTCVGVPNLFPAWLGICR